MSIRYIGFIPIDNYLEYLIYNKKFNRNLAIKYTKDIYNVDISNINFEEYYNGNIYEDFEKVYKGKKDNVDKRTREYFTLRGKHKFYKFLEFKHSRLNEDEIFQFTRGDVVHHIHPLIYSNDNSIKNLILISDFHHQILHSNPLEEYKTFSYQAIDYLYYLYNTEKFNELFSSMIDMFKKNNNEIHILKNFIILEMNKFYTNIQKNNGNNFNNTYLENK